MTKFLAALGTALVLTIPLLVRPAQSGPGPGNCDEVRQAVATYGYAAAKRHAMAHYSRREVRAADRCVTGRSRRG